MQHFKNLPIGNVFLSHDAGNVITVTIYTSRTALILGTDDANINALRDILAKKYSQFTFVVEVREIKKPELSASIVADSIARQIEKKMPYRRVIKNAISKTLEKG